MTKLRWFFGWVAYILVFISKLCVGFLNILAKLGLISKGSGYQPLPKDERQVNRIKKKTGK